MKKEVEPNQDANAPGLNIDGVVRSALIIKTMNWTEPQKAKEGVTVRFIYDDFGSRAIRKKLVPRLKANGIHAFPTPPREPDFAVA